MANMTALERCRHFNVTNIQGMAYMPGPTDYDKSAKPGLYENSDFYNNIFVQLWGSENPNGFGEQGRKDIYRFRQQLGVNFIHCYDWTAPVRQRDEKGVERDFLQHATFLEACHRLDMSATIPISNYTMKLLSVGNEDAARRNVERVIGEIYSANIVPNKAPLAGAGMWKIFNEYELCFDKNPKHVVTVMSWLAEWEHKYNVQDNNRLPVMVCTSFGLNDGIEGAGALKAVRDVLLKEESIGAYAPAEFWNERIVFATNPQNPGADIKDYLARRLPGYWNRHNIPIPPVMFTELGSTIEQTGSEQEQARWLSEQIAASKPGSSNGMMLGACVFLNEERPWEAGPERTFGIMRFGSDSGWGWPRQNYQAQTKYPVWDPKGWWWQQGATYPVEQQTAKLNYQSVVKAWGPHGSP